MAFVDDDATVGEDKVRDAVNGHAFEDVEVDGVVVRFRGNCPEKTKNILCWDDLKVVNVIGNFLSKYRFPPHVVEATKIGDCKFNLEPGFLMIPHDDVSVRPRRDYAFLRVEVEDLGGRGARH